MMKTETKEAIKQGLYTKYKSLIDQLMVKEMTAKEIGAMVGLTEWKKIYTLICTLSLNFPIYESDDEPAKLKILTKEDLNA